ncbi:glycosyltransferase [candidate division KSB1 bacterium]|nr:glycosyltransferase [candidate division KSB1 bacterium]
MNILTINWQDIKNPLGGGAEVHLHEIFKRIVSMGHNVTLLCCTYENAMSEEYIDGIQIFRRGHRNFFNFVVPHNYFLLNKKINFDIIVDDINKIPFYTPLYVKKPLIGIIHHLFGSSIFMETSLPGALYVNMAEKLIPPIYKNIPMTVVSKSTREELIDKGFHDDNLHIIHNGVDMSGFRAEKKARSSNPTIGYFGRIKKYKSIDHILKAFKIVLEKLPKAQLLIMGDGDYLPEIRQQAKKLQLDGQIDFTGPLMNSEKLKHLNKVWFTVNPSPKEGWGLTVIESNACALPVIAADSPGLRESVVDKKTGLLYEYGNIEQLASQMILLIENQQLRETLSENSLEWAKKFSWDRSAEKMLHLLEKTIS